MCYVYGATVKEISKEEGNFSL